MLNIDNLRTTEQDITGYYLECHGPNSRCEDEINAWVARMIDMIGLDDCEFLIRSRQPHLNRLWISKKKYIFEPNIADAGRFSWGETAVKITNNPKLEAIRIINENEAVDSKGASYRLLKRRETVEGPPPMPDYQGRWGLDYGDGDNGSAGKHNYGQSITAQNGELLPGPGDE